MKILFVGNSYLYYAPDGTPEASVFRQFVQLAALAGHSVEYATSFIGGASPAALWNDTTGVTAQNEIKTGSYDAVVVTTDIAADFDLYADLFADLSHANGAKAIWYGVWPADQSSSINNLSFATTLHEAALTAAVRNGAAYSPNAMAYKAAYEALSALYGNGDNGEAAEAILTADNVHPAIFGTYLYANLLFRTVFGEAPANSDVYVPAGISPSDAALAWQIAQTVAAQYALPFSGAISVSDAANARIEGRYFVDDNQNGLDDVSDSGQSGAAVRLLDMAGALVATATTDLLGQYSFSGLAAGSYRVEFAAPLQKQGFVNPGSDSLVTSVSSSFAGQTNAITLGTQTVIRNIDAGAKAVAAEPPPSFLVDPAPYSKVYIGTAGPDIQTGTSAADYFLGAGGNDTISAYYGADFISGGGGADDINAGADNDILVYDRLDFRLNGGTGRDTLISATDATLTAGLTSLLSIEVIDLRNTYRDNIAFSYAQIKASRGQELRIYGDAGDVVDIDTTLSLRALGSVTENGILIDRYELGTTLFGVQHGLEFFKGLAPSFIGFSTITLAENTTRVTDLSAIDDVGIEGAGLAFALAGGADAALFTVNPVTGVVDFIVAPDFEAPNDQNHDNIYSFFVRVTDGDGLTTVCQQTVTVTDINESTGPKLNDPGPISISENAILVVDLSTTHSGETESGGGLMYSILGGADANLFRIDPLTGVVSFRAAPDYEAPGDFGGDNIYSLQVEVADSIGSADIIDLAVTVADAYENVAPFLATPAPIALPEDTKSVIDLQALDDTDAELSGLIYTISGGADAALFRIDGATGAVSFMVAPDFESPGDADGDNVYNVQVGVTDRGGLSDTVDLLVTITDAAENAAPDIATPDPIFVAEATRSVVDLQTVDDFSSEGIGLTYAITAGADAGLFRVDAATGVVSFLIAPDYEAPGDAGGNNVYDLQVGVTDSGGLTDMIDLVVTVTDVDDNAAPDLIAPGPIRLAEGATTVFNLQATDDNNAERAGLIYAIFGGADAALFSIDAETGVVSFLAAPDYEMPTDAGSNNIYDILVGVTDSGGLTDTTGLTVQVTDVGELPNPALFDRIFTGGALAETISGTNANDYMRAFDGNDTVSGYTGNDFLDGGLGIDSLIGGLGNDTFVFEAADIAVNGSTGVDTLLVFSGGFADVRGTTLSSIEKISMQDGLLTSFHINDAQLRSSRNQELRIYGDDDDSLNIHRARPLTYLNSVVEQGQLIDRYTYGAVVLGIDHDINIQLLLT